VAIQTKKPWRRDGKHFFIGRRETSASDRSAQREHRRIERQLISKLSSSTPCSLQDLQLWNVEDNFGLVRRYTEHQHLEYQIKSCFGGRDRSFVISASEGTCGQVVSGSIGPN
jgi:hypothetical protein